MSQLLLKDYFDPERKARFIPGKCVYCGKTESRDSPMLIVGYGTMKNNVHDKCYQEWFASRQDGPKEYNNQRELF